MGGPPRAARQEPDRKESEMAEKKKARRIKVLVEHEGEKLLVAEGRVESHAAHGAEVIDPIGCAGEEGGTR
jgi:hypothetical protein